MNPLSKVAELRLPEPEKTKILADMTPLVFLPGTLCDERLWYNQTAVFKNFHHVNLRRQDNMQDMILEVAKAPFQEFIVVGFSMGGYIAQEFALQFPERVKHVVVLGSSFKGCPPHEREVVQKALPMIEKGLFKGITPRRMKEFLHPDSYEKTELRDLIQSMAGSDAAAVYLRQLKATFDRPDLTERIKKLTAPLTALGGNEDLVVLPESVLDFKKILPNADVRLVDRCGHFVPLERPEVVNETLFQLAK